MFLGVLPQWIGDILSVLGLPAILLAVVLFLLNRKDANRKLEVEEGSLKRSEFDSITNEYSELYKTADARATAAESKADSAMSRVGELNDEVVDLRDMIHQLRSLFRRVLNRNNIQMTSAEQEEFDRIKPPPRRRPVPQ